MANTDLKPSKKLIKELTGLVSESAEFRTGTLRYHVWKSLKALTREMVKEVDKLKRELGYEETIKLLTRYVADPDYADDPPVGVPGPQG